MKEEFKITKFNILTENIEFETVVGERILINKIPCFIFTEEEETEQGIVEGYNISHIQTGLRICSDISRNECIKKATIGLKINSLQIKKSIKKLSQFKMILPVNK